MLTKLITTLIVLIIASTFAFAQMDDLDAKVERKVKQADFRSCLDLVRKTYTEAVQKIAADAKVARDKAKSELEVAKQSKDKAAIKQAKQTRKTVHKKAKQDEKAVKKAAQATFAKAKADCKKQK